MSNELRFCSSVSLNNLNPLNHALRNDYIANLVGLGFKTLTVLETILGEPIDVVAGFKSKKSEGHRHFIFDKYLCSGNAFEVTSKSYDMLNMIDILKKMSKGLRDNCISAVLFDKSVMFIAEYEDKCGIYRFDGRPILISEY